MTKTAIAKKVVGTVSSHAAGFATARVIVANAPTNGGLYERACVVVGALVIGAMCGERVEQFTDKQIDAITGAFEQAKSA